MAKTIAKDYETGQIFRSMDELYISWYLQELQDHGYIEKWAYEPETFQLGNGENLLRKTSYEQLQTKVKESCLYPMLIGKHEYTPDFKIKLNPKAEWIFFNFHSGVISETIPFILYKSMIGILEVKFEKGKFQGSKAKTNISRKWLLDKHDKFAQEIRYKELFVSSFTPKRYIEKKQW